MVLWRRLIVLAALAFWQGGFSFYAGLVIPIGQEVLASGRDQGFVTQRVTNSSNLAGAIALVPFAWDIIGSRNGLRSRLLRWLTWIALAVSLALLFWIHIRIDALLDFQDFAVSDRSAFHAWHKAYEIASTVNWFFAVVYAFLSLRAWRAEDRIADFSECTAATTLPF